MVPQYQECDFLVQGHSKGITKVAFSPSGIHIATAGLDGRVCIWDAATGNLLYSFIGTSGILSLLWLPGGDELLVCGLADGHIACLDIGGDSIEANGFLAHHQPVECLSVKDDYLVSGACEEVAIWKWDAEVSKYTIYKEIEPPTVSRNEWQEILVTSVQWASPPEGPLLLIVTYMNHGVVLINAETWACENTLATDGQIACAAVSEDGSYIAVSNVVRGFDIYSLSTGVLLCSLDHDIRRTIPTQVNWIHGGFAIVGGSTAGQLTLWDVSDLDDLSDKRSGNQSLGRGRVLYRLPLPEHAMSVAIAAHYDAKDDMFFIAAGIMDADGPSPCVVWCGKQHSIDAPVTANGAGRLLKCSIWLSWFVSGLCLVLLAHLWFSIPDADKQSLDE